MLKESKSDSNFVPDFVDNNSLPDISFNGRCLIKNNTSISEKVINLYISYTLGPKLWNSINCLFGYVRLTKNADLNKYKYAGYGIGFDSFSKLLFIVGSSGKMLLFLELIWAHLCILIIKENTS